MYKLEHQFLSGNSPKRPKGNYGKTSITIHSTANEKSTPQNERDWLDNPSNSRDASWHYVVGDGVVIQAIPELEEAWHSGTSQGNKYSIGIEIVESGNRKAVIETAAEFVSDLLKKYNWGADKLKKHYNWTGKNCPRILIDKSFVKNNVNWNYFIERVEHYMEKRYNKISELPTWAKPTIQKLVNEGKIADGNNLDMTEDMLRVIVILSR